MKYKPTKHVLIGKWANFEADVGDFTELLIAYYNDEDTLIGSLLDESSDFGYDWYRYSRLRGLRVEG